MTASITADGLAKFRISVNLANFHLFTSSYFEQKKEAPPTSACGSGLQLDLVGRWLLGAMAETPCVCEVTLSPHQDGTDSQTGGER